MRDAGKLFRVSERTIRNWETGRVLVPYAAFKLMRILRGYELPGAAWKGYRLVGDTLWSPEGLAFHPWDASWWSLTVRMAREFRRLVGKAGPGAAPSAPGSAARSESEIGVSGRGAPGLVLSSTSDTGIGISSGKPGSEVTGQSPVVVLGVAA